jgi:hypothetical protein
VPLEAKIVVLSAQERQNLLALESCIRNEVFDDVEDVTIDVARDRDLDPFVSMWIVHQALGETRKPDARVNCERFTNPTRAQSGPNCCGRGFLGEAPRAQP